MSTLFESETIILLLSAIVAFASVMAFVLPFIKRNKGDARRREIAERRNELSREQREGDPAAGADRRGAGGARPI